MDAHYTTAIVLEEIVLGRMASLIHLQLQKPISCFVGKHISECIYIKAGA